MVKTFPVVIDFISPIHLEARSFKPFLSKIPTTERVKRNNVIYLVLTKASPSVDRIVKKSNPDTKPVVIHAIITTAIVSSFNKNPIIIIRIPISFIVTIN
jgi:hypothetical protein